MQYFSILVAALGAFPLAISQVITWCKEKDCGGCVSSITSPGTGYPDCVIYDTETVFGGQGFQEGTDSILYNVWAQMSEPCGGEVGNLMVRSPAALATVGCGDLIYDTTEAECSASLALQDTSMVQFCCGAGDCQAAGVPWGRRIGIGGHTDRLSTGGLQGVYLTFPNGTVIEPIAVGRSPFKANMKRQCEGWKEDSYIASGEPYLKTFDTYFVSDPQPAQDQDREVEITQTVTVETSTSFDVSIGDPFGIISLSVGFEFSRQQQTSVSYKFTVPAGQTGRVGFTPVYICTTGTLEDCDGNVSPENESCTAYLTSGSITGDYALVQE